MLILTPENTTLEIDYLPEDLEKDIRYCVLDLSKPSDPDFFWIPLTFLESFNSPAVVMEIGDYRIKMPVLESPNDWKILAADKDSGDIELISIEDINSREFHALSFNPLKSIWPEFLPITITQTFTDIKWYFPKLLLNNLLVVPLEPGENPKCVFFINGMSARKLDSVKLSDIIG